MGHLVPQIPQTGDDDDDTELGLAAVRLANCAAYPMVFKAAVELGVIDILYAATRADVTGSGSFLTPSEITTRLPTKPSNPEAPALLDRMLLLLASYSMVKCQVVEELGTLASQLVVTLDTVFLNTWAQLKDVVLEGGVAFGRANGGLKLFDYISKDERLSKLFNRTGFSVGVLKKFLQVYRGFEEVNVLVDVGGGVGDTVGFLTSKYPNIKDVPKGDAIILKRILHDWTDEDCEKILKNCWKSLPENGKVIIMEVVTPDEAEIGDVQSNIAFDMDLLMLTQLSGGKERSRAEYEAMAANAGFAHCNFVCRAYHLWVIEFSK
ncbi:Indole glucosinolate O-methyltransferase 5 [Cardamine amara subsp. amara]|uniref:Indole glucosinolate O-methyltransferase 5 n=1 Tax=Cardamine amara subsp. amara TaxID=228776 RepID=A0ABD0Z5K5_CARAN